MSTRLLNNAEAAARIGISPATLKLWRHEGKSPPFIKNNPHSPQSGVSYDPADLDAWLAERKFASTSAYSPAARSNVKAKLTRSAGASA